MIKRIINWPMKKTNNYRPLYQIIWRVIWYPILQIGLLIAAFSLLITGDKDYAEDLLKDYSIFQ